MKADVVQRASIGCGESGKSTVLKQMKIIHMSGYTNEEAIAYRRVVYRNVVESIQALIQAVRDFKMSFANPMNEVNSVDLNLRKFFNNTSTSSEVNCGWAFAL